MGVIYSMEQLGRKESLLSIFDVYLNRLQEIWQYNVDITKNKDMDNWIQLQMRCRKCGFEFVERLIGNGFNSHVVIKDKKKLISEEYVACCPYCHNKFMVDATRPMDVETLAMDIHDDVNTGIQEIDDETKENKLK